LVPSLGRTTPLAKSDRQALGRKRAAYCRSFPNLLKARKVSARNRKALKQARLFAEAKLHNPFALEKRPRGF
jgi:hypothetical protein